MNKHVSRILIGSLVVLGAMCLAGGMRLLVQHYPQAFLLLLFTPFVYLAGAFVEEIWTDSQERKKMHEQE